MHYDNVFELIISVVFYMSPQLGGPGPKAKGLVIPFHPGEVEHLPDFYLRALTIISELELMIYQKGKINNPKGKYIMKLSKLKHLQWSMTSYEIEYRRFERHPQSGQPSLTFTPKMEEILETL